MQVNMHTVRTVDSKKSERRLVYPNQGQDISAGHLNNLHVTYSLTICQRYML